MAAADGGVTPVGTDFLSLRLWNGAWSAWAVYGSPFTLAGVDGVRYVEYRSQDLLGNQEAFRNETLVLDDTPPTTTLSPETGPFTPTTSFTSFAMDAGSGVSGTEVRIDGGAWSPYTTGFMMAAGDHNVSYRSVDRLGNREQERTRAVHVQGPPQPPPPEAANLKPFIAAAFGAVLLLVGGWSARRAPWPTGSRRRLRAFALAAMPFVAVESATGLVSLLTGLLVIPPLLGAGTAIDLGILVAGILVSAYRARAGKPLT